MGKGKGSRDKLFFNIRPGMVLIGIKSINGINSYDVLKSIQTHLGVKSIIRTKKKPMRF